MRADPELVLAAVENKAVAMNWASPGLLADLNFVREAVARNAGAKSFVSDELKATLDLWTRRGHGQRQKYQLSHSCSSESQKKKKKY
mmetsp:Transcript_32765/g.66202  ORF Transcript_32765/g.66202 Transcript_32765/m.66202 type:complete len:87 (-) Transcript_32765:14-274(-)